MSRRVDLRNSGIGSHHLKGSTERCGETVLSAHRYTCAGGRVSEPFRHCCRWRIRERRRHFKGRRRHAVVVEIEMRSCIGRRAKRRETPGLLKVFCGLVHSDVGRVLWYIYRHTPCRCSSCFEAGAGCGSIAVAVVWRATIKLPWVGVEYWRTDCRFGGDPRSILRSPGSFPRHRLRRKSIRVSLPEFSRSDDILYQRQLPQGKRGAGSTEDVRIHAFSAMLPPRTWR